MVAGRAEGAGSAAGWMRKPAAYGVRAEGGAEGAGLPVDAVVSTLACSSGGRRSSSVISTPFVRVAETPFPSLPRAVRVLVMGHALIYVK